MEGDAKVKKQDNKGEAFNFNFYLYFFFCCSAAHKTVRLAGQSEKIKGHGGVSVTGRQRLIRKKRIRSKKRSLEAEALPVGEVEDEALPVGEVEGMA